jgi:hypothetical protein
MSKLGGYSNLSAAGSRLKRWTVRPSDWAWVMREAQKVDLPAPAGPVTSTASTEGTRELYRADRKAEEGDEQRIDEKSGGGCGGAREQAGGSGRLYWSSVTLCRCL